MQYKAIAEQNPQGVGMAAFRQYSELECQMLDVGWWYGAMTAGTDGNNSILEKMFAILWYGGLYYRPKHGTWQPWSDTNMPIATALSRSGGVVVQYQQLPGGQRPLWEWLFERQQPDHRSHATHGIERGNYGAMPNNQPKNFKENKKDEGNHSGINLAGGGLGNRNPITGKRIQEDGRHGHLYFCHTAATMDQPGGFLVKAESSAPLDTADGLFMNSPYWRDNPNQRAAMLALSPIWFVPWFGAALADTLTGGGTLRQPVGFAAGAMYPQAQTGDFHALGVSGERGVTGGKKFKSIIKFDENVPYGADGYDAMFVNPTADTVDRLIRREWTFDANDLGRSPPAPALPQPAANQTQTELRVNAVLVPALRDVIKQYEKEASGFFARSSKESQQVMGWITGVVGTDAANVTYRNGEMPMQGGPLLWTLKYYVRGSGQPAAVGAPAVRLTQGGRLHTMLAGVVASGDQAVARP